MKMEKLFCQVTENTKLEFYFISKIDNMVSKMCLAIPGKVIEINGEYAQVDFGGITKRVGIALLDSVSENDYVIVHAGYAIEVLNKADAEERLKLFEEINQGLE
jgi:hydrogenase expression/formation protein HypC